MTNGDESLEPDPLTGTGLLLNRHDLEYLILERRPDEVIDDFVLLDGQREEVDLLQGLDLAVLDEAAQLSHRDPLLLLFAVPAAASAAAATTAPASAAITAAPAVAAATPAAKTSSESTTIGWSSVRHF